jgi:hypothetical protein
MIDADSTVAVATAWNSILGSESLPAEFSWVLAGYLVLATVIYCCAPRERPRVVTM